MTNNLKTLGTNLINDVSQKISVESTAEIQEYIKFALTEAKYKELRSTALEQFGRNKHDKVVLQMEIQDYYLSNPDLPSRRGKLVSDDWNRHPQLAVDCHFLRKGTYSLTSRGHLFLALIPQKERSAFNVTGADLAANINPFLLSLPQKLLLLFTLVDADGDLLRQLYSVLLKGHGVFTVAEAGNYLPDIYRTIAKEFRSRVRSGDDFIRLQRLIDTADNIEAIKRNPNPGGKNAREHAITVRLEPFVDIGLITKNEPFSYAYNLDERARSFFRSLIESEGVDDFLNNRFFYSVNGSLDLKMVHNSDLKSNLAVIQKAYGILKSPVGYSPILELSMLASIYSFVEDSTYFEVNEGIEMLKSLQKEHPELVRFNVDRWGMLNFVKLSDDLEKTRI